MLPTDISLLSRLSSWPQMYIQSEHCDVEFVFPCPTPKTVLPLKLLVLCVREEPFVVPMMALLLPCRPSPPQASPARSTRSGLTVPSLGSTSRVRLVDISSDLYNRHDMFGRIAVSCALTIKLSLLSSLTRDMLGMLRSA